VRSLREKLDECAELLATLLLSTAGPVDEATAPGSDVAGYARAQICRAHALVIEQLARATAIEGGDGWDQLLAAAQTVTPRRGFQGPS
jgi:hypothetical protein